MPKNRELVGRFVSEDHAFGESPNRVIIGQVDTGGLINTTIKGEAEELELVRGITYRFYGHTRHHPKYGEQFWFTTFVEDEPVDSEAVKTYLKRMCGGSRSGSISPSVASALVDHFGAESIDKIIERPAEAVAVVQEHAPRSRWDEDKARIAAQVLRDNADRRRAKIDLIALLDGRGFPKKTIDRALREWGNAAANVIRDNPYVLMQFAGIGFRTADQMYCDVCSHKSESPAEYQTALGWIQRQAYAAAQGILERRDGSVWYPRGMAESAVRQLIPSAIADPSAALDHAFEQGVLIECERDGQKWVAIPRMANHEQTIAECVNDILTHEPNLWPDFEMVGSKMDGHQIEQVSIALDRPIGILSGSPGCGKTYCVALIVNELVKRFGADTVAIACPTGKAAVRCSEALNENGVRDVEVSTIHRLLIVQNESSSGGWSFFHGRENPLPHKFIIVDESSMIDTSLMASLLRALAAGTHVLLVGDAGQLAPVGDGKPFLDLQQCVPTGRLTEIKRNKGRIVRACAEMRDHRTFTPSPKMDIDADENLPFIDSSDDIGGVIDRLLDQLQQCGENVVWDTQVICAVNKNSPVARQPLNLALQKKLNPHAKQLRGNPFRVGDKIVCLSNGWFPSLDGGNQLFVANGELAEVVDLEVGRMFVKLTAPDREIVVPHRVNDSRDDGDSSDSSKGALGDWDLGYALSVHKSQGSQWPNVIVVIDSSGAARQVQTLNWLYTAISRASVVTFCVGELRVAQAACRRDGISDRKTFLVEQIRRDAVGRDVDDSVLFAEV